jgi:hypothetical protein
MHAIDTASLAAADLFRRDPERLWSETTKELVRLIHSNIFRQDSSGKEYLQIAVSAAIDLAANVSLICPRTFLCQLAMRSTTCLSISLS